MQEIAFSLLRSGMLTALIAEINREERELAPSQLSLVSFYLPRREMSTSFAEMLLVW